MSCRSRFPKNRCSFRRPPTISCAPAAMPWVSPYQVPMACRDPGDPAPSRQEARPLPVLPTHSHSRSAPLPVLFLGFGSGLHSAAFSPAAWSGSSLGGKVRRGGSSAAAVAEGGHYSDDPSRDERPPNYDPNGEQLDVASQHEPGIISGKGQCSDQHPHEDPKKEEDRSQDSLANLSAMSRGQGGPAKRDKLVRARCWSGRSPPR